MKKLISVELRNFIEKNDALNLIKWLDDFEVVKYMNESKDISNVLTNILDNRQEVLKINHDYFEKNINEKKDFIILISLSTCLNCLKVKSILNDYIKEKNKLIYEIELNEYTSIDSSIFYYPIDHTPLLVFIKEGNVVDEKQKNLIDKDEVFNLLNSKIN